MKTFDVVIRCHIGMLSTVCALGENDERVEIVSVNASPVVRTRYKRSPRSGKMDVATAVMQVLADGKPRPFAEIAKTSAKLHGFEPKSASAALTKLKTTNQVESLGGGVWRKKS